MKRRTGWGAFAALAAAFALAIALPAMAQSFNIDFGNTLQGPGFGSPAATYGAASGQVGTWQSINGVTANTPIILNGLNGAPTTVTITSLNTVQGFGATANGAAGGDDALLLNDALDLGFPGTQHTFTFNNLANGTYDVFIYAMAPDSASARTRVNVNGPSPGLGSQVCGGQYTGVFVVPVTHVVFDDVAISAGQMEINTINSFGFGALAGIQVIQVPSPGGLAVLGLASMIGGRRRRRAPTG